MAADSQFILFDDDDVPGIIDPAMGSIIPGAFPSLPPGHSTPRNGQRVPRAAGGELPYAFDWSVGRGVAAVDPRGFKLGCRTLEELIRAVPRGSVVVGEATFDSYDLRQRQRVMDLAVSREVTLLTVPARGNTRRREAAGLPEKTSQSRQTDYEDALAIQQAAASGAHLKVPAAVDPAWAELREKARRRFIRLRYSGQKDKYAADLLYERRVPPFILQPLERRIALGPRERYSLVIVAAVGVAAEFVSGRADFERLTGLCAHGYPSQFRSDLMHWGWGRRPEKQQRISLSVYRREVRWLFHQLKGDVMAQQSVPGVAASDTANMSGQAGGGSGSVFGDLGGGKQQGTEVPNMGDGARNALGNPTGNPSGAPEWGQVPAQDSVFGTDLGGAGVAGQTQGAALPNTSPAAGPRGQGG